MTRRTMGRTEGQADAMELVRIGYGNLVSASRLVAVVGPDSAPVRRLVQEARDRGSLIDASSGRKTRSILVMDSDHVILSALTPEEMGLDGAGPLRDWAKEGDRTP